MALLQSLAVTNLGFKGQQPPVTNPNPLGPNGQTCLNVSSLDLANGGTPTGYLSNLPQ
jgi:hypothetical protein